MDAGPDESGTFLVGKVCDGKFCTEVPIDDIQQGDYIQFYRQGTRCRCVKDVHRGRKHNYVKFVPFKSTPFKNQRINLKDIQSVWRKHEQRPDERGQPSAGPEH